MTACDLLGARVEGQGSRLPYVSLPEIFMSRGVEGLSLVLEASLHEDVARRPASYGVLVRALRDSAIRTSGSLPIQSRGGAGHGGVEVDDAVLVYSDDSTHEDEVAVSSPEVDSPEQPAAATELETTGETEAESEPVILNPETGETEPDSLEAPPLEGFHRRARIGRDRDR